VPKIVRFDGSLT